MKLQPQCILCLLQWVYGRGSAAAEDKDVYFKAVRHMLAEADANATGKENTALVSNKLVDRMGDVVGDATTVYYKNLKKECNKNAKKMLDRAREYIYREPLTRRSKLERACRIACAGNVAPLGSPSHGFCFDEVKSVLNETLKPVIQDGVFEALEQADNILYVMDNAGEIGFDSLLISQLKDMGCSVTILVKEPVFFEDATLEDTCFFSLDKLTDTVVTVKGIFVPGVPSSAYAMDAFENADLIIAKGTGNFEALKGEIKDKPIIYMLKVKCTPIAASTGINLGQFIIAVDK